MEISGMTNDESVVPNVPTENFSDERWAKLTQPLRMFEHVFRRLAAEHGSELIASSRWPEIRFKRKSLLLVHEVRLSLLADNAGSRVPEWAVRVVRYARFPPLLSKRRSVEEITRLTDDALRGDPEFLQKSLSTALRRLM